MRHILVIASAGVLVYLGAARFRSRLTPAHVEAAIVRGVGFLASHQRASGMWPQLTCAEASLRNRCHADPTVLSTAFALRSVATIPEPRLAPLKERAGQFLLREQTSSHLWKYWTPQYPQRYGWDVVADLDDSSMAAEALAASGIPAVRIDEFLLKQQDRSGRLYLWVYPDASTLSDQREYDCVSDANVLAYLARWQQEAPAVCQFLRQVVEEGLNIGCSDYYVHSEMLAYAVARAIRQGATCLQPSAPALLRWLVSRQRRDGSWTGVFGTALAVNALVNLRGPIEPIEHGVRFLLKHQQAEGGWPAEVYYLMNTAGKPMHRTPLINVDTGEVVVGHQVLPEPNFFGSRSVTTALVLEALAGYRALTKPRQP